MKQEFIETKKARILEKLELITNLYDLIFEGDLPHDIKKLKMNLKFTGSEQEIKIVCKNIANHIKFLEIEDKNKSDESYLDIAKKLKEIFGQLVNVIREEFRTLRDRNSRLPELEQYL